MSKATMPWDKNKTQNISSLWGNVAYPHHNQVFAHFYISIRKVKTLLKHITELKHISEEVTNGK